MTGSESNAKAGQLPHSMGKRASAGRWRIGLAEFDEASGCLTVGEQAVELDHSGRQLLSCLLLNAGTLVPKDDLLAVGWPGRIATESSLTKAIHRLRQAMGDPEGNLLCTVHGYGYRLAARVDYLPAVDPPPVGPSGVLPVPLVGAASERTESGWRRGRWLTVAAAISFAVGLAYSLRSPLPEPTQEQFASPSILVLPFVDLSQAHDQGYMAAGIMEEIQNRLAQGPSLRVIGPATSSSFEGKKVDVQAIGRSLGISHILQGSVRSSKNRIRVTAHLVATKDAVAIWSQTYDPDLDDVFALQDEIALAVASQLKVRLLSRSRPKHIPEPRAYALVQKTRQLERLGVDNIDDYGPLIRQAVAIDPEYSDAWYILGISYLDEISSGRRSRAPGLKLARSAYEKALSLDPDNVVVYALLGNLSHFHEGDSARAARYFEQALEIDGGNLKVLFMGAALANDLERTDDAIRAMEYVVDRDPVNAFTQSVLGYFYYRARRWDDAIARFRTALAISPEMNRVNAAIGDALRHKGQLIPSLGAYGRERDERYRLNGLVISNHLIGRKAESDLALKTLLSKYGALQDDGESYLLIATSMAQRGDSDQAFAWLVKASALGLDGLEQNTDLSGLHSDARWLPFLRKNGKMPEQLAAARQVNFKLQVPLR